MFYILKHNFRITTNNYVYHEEHEELEEEQKQRYSSTRGSLNLCHCEYRYRHAEQYGYNMEEHAFTRHREEGTDVAILQVSPSLIL